MNCLFYCFVADVEFPAFVGHAGFEELLALSTAFLKVGIECNWFLASVYYPSCFVELGCNGAAASNG